ncbi:MAG: class I SAM-dependent methyltransferase [Blastocatellia bacterium]
MNAFSSAAGKNVAAVSSQSSDYKPAARQNLMHPIRWVPQTATSLLDVGCNAGELLSYCRMLYPSMKLVGVDVNREAVNKARIHLPDAEFEVAGADSLPFPDGVFECVTCIEVLEHIPSNLRQKAFAEIRRVLRPGGRLVLRVPHAGLFAWMDAANLRFRLPGLYKAIVREGRRDAGYPEGSEGVVWHQHFKKSELIELAGSGWEIQAHRRGGLFLLPLMDIACWPFYRVRKIDNPVFRFFQRVMDFDIGWDYGRASYDVLVVLRRN